MNLGPVRAIADAVMYEGFILYPYRPTALKNRRRWTFGLLVPEEYSLAGAGAEAACMQTECLASVGATAGLESKVRFLQPVAREVGELATPMPELPHGSDIQYKRVEVLEASGHVFQPWQEAVEREIDIPAIRIAELAAGIRRVAFTFEPSVQFEAVRNGDGQVVGIIRRLQRGIQGAVELSAQLIDSDLYRVCVRVTNTSPIDQQGDMSPDDLMLRSLASTHVILGLSDGEFVSLMDPPDRMRAAATGCRNIGTWPVLVGSEGERSLMLSSPIILYDYPRVSSESGGDFFDGTEIDEMLALRVMTLTDDEKALMRHVDQRARQILERTETLPPAQLLKLHGVVRSTRPIVQSRGDSHE